MILQALLLELQNLEEAARKSKEPTNVNNRAINLDSEAEIPVCRCKKRKIEQIILCNFLGEYRNSNDINS